MVHPNDLEIVILAGGLSRRMGVDKTSLRIGGKTILNHVLTAARSQGKPVRVIRRDIVPRCGPLGGVMTALKSSPCQQVLFLACDMPFVSPRLLYSLRRFAGPKERPVFTIHRKKLGFPFIVGRQFLPQIESRLQAKLFSLTHFAQSVHARIFEGDQRFEIELFNLNRPADWRRAQSYWKCHQKRSLIGQARFQTKVCGSAPIFGRSGIGPCPQWFGLRPYCGVERKVLDHWRSIPKHPRRLRGANPTNLSWR